MTITHTFTEAERIRLRLSGDDGAITRARTIAGEAALAAGMTLARLIGTERTPQVVKARDIAIFRAHQEGIQSTQIGKAFNRDHSTVLCAIRRERARRGEASA